MGLVDVGDEAPVVGEGALFQALSLGLCVVLPNHIGHVEHLLDVIDLRLEVTSKLALCHLDLMLHLVLHVVEQDHLILLEPLIKVVLKLLTHPKPDLLLVPPTLLILLRQHAIPILIMQLYLLLHL